MKELFRSIVFLAVMTVGLGFVYPLTVWGVSQIFFSHQANGSLIEQDGKIVGSELIGQNFTSDKYFHSRPSAAGNGYDAGASSGSNLGPTSEKLHERVRTDAAAIVENGNGQPVPADLVTTSASGLDPHISPAAARFQAERVANARGLSLPEVGSLIEKYTERRTFGVLGEERVNVLKLNLELDRISGHQ